MSSDHVLRVTLLDVAVPGRPGSMSRYGDLVTAAVNATGDRGIQVERVEMSTPAVFRKLAPARLDPWLGRAWLALNASKALKRRHPDVVHVLDASSSLFVAVRTGLPVVATIHDLIPLLQLRRRLPGPQPSALARRVIERLPRHLARADVLIADSDRTAEDVAALTTVPRHRVVTVPLAVHPDLLTSSSTGRALPRKPYVLHVGGASFYKNRAGVLRIVARVRRVLPVTVVLAGAPPGADLLSEAAGLGLDSIEYRPNPSDAELSALYRNAGVMLMPSLYEGFGWPVLEAMALGCPVVCSAAGSLLEVAQDAALTAPPDDEETLAGHVLRVLREPSFARGLVARGTKRAATFRLDRLGTQLVSCYGAAARR